MRLLRTLPRIRCNFTNATGLDRSGPPPNRSGVQPYFCVRRAASAIWSCRKVTKSMPWAFSAFG
jgi:hypothetical protein